MPKGSLVQKPKAIFTDVVVATAGDRGRKGWSDPDVARYVKVWGGNFSADLDESVTHLLATEAQWKNKVPRGSLVIPPDAVNGLPSPDLRSPYGSGKD
jgi:hypothetical protein